MVNVKYKWRLDPTSKKFECPACGARRFVRYVDDAGNYAPPEFGRCDREQNCGYFKPPTHEKGDALTLVVERVPARPASCIPMEIVSKSQSQIFYQRNFYRAFSKYFFENRLKNVCAAYFVGVAKNYDAVFWQVQRARNSPGGFKCFAGKAFKYNAAGHREKTMPVNWAHKLLNLENFNLQQIPFGLHEIGDDASVIVNVVESEKTAILMRCAWPWWVNNAWIAVGGKNNLKNALNNARFFLEKRKLVLWPDFGCEDAWKEIMKQLHFNNWQINMIAGGVHDDGLDLWDLALRLFIQKSCKTFDDFKKSWWASLFYPNY